MTPATATAPPTDADLVSIIEAYTDVTGKLKESHDALAGEVCRLREQLDAKNMELQRRDRLSSLGCMAAGVAHEIRNPLGGIRIYISLLERDLVDQPKQRDLARKSLVGIGNLEGIVSDVLAFAGDVTPNLAPTRLGSVLEAAVGQVTPKADATNVVLDVAEELDRLSVVADADQLQRAFVNLLFNAIDAAGRDGHVWIRRRASATKTETLLLVVEDDGPGVDLEMVNRVFDPFFTTKGTGTGLGLAIVHRVVESHGGTVRAEVRDGGGASFVLNLPLAPTTVGSPRRGAGQVIGHDSTGPGLDRDRFDGDKN